MTEAPRRAPAPVAAGGLGGQRRRDRRLRGSWLVALGVVLLGGTLLGAALVQRPRPTATDTGAEPGEP